MAISRFSDPLGKGFVFPEQLQEEPDETQFGRLLQIVPS